MVKVLVVINMVHIKPRKIHKKYLSHYLHSGQQKETFDLHLLDISTNHISTQIKFKKFHTDKEGYNNPLGDHLSMNSALTIFSQSTIAMECLNNGKTKNELGEVISINFNLKTSTPISIKDQIICKVKILSETSHKLGTKKKCEFSFNNGAFIGTCDYIVQN